MRPCSLHPRAWPRRAASVDYPLAAVLALAVTAILANQRSDLAIAQWARCQPAAWPRLRLPAGTDVLPIDPAPLVLQNGWAGDIRMRVHGGPERGFCASGRVAADGDGHSGVAIDGKVLRTRQLQGLRQAPYGIRIGARRAPRSRKAWPRAQLRAAPAPPASALPPADAGGAVPRRRQGVPRPPCTPSPRSDVAPRTLTCAAMLPGRTLRCPVLPHPLFIQCSGPVHRRPRARAAYWALEGRRVPAPALTRAAT